VGNRFDGCRSDGLDIAQSQRVLVLANQAVNFQPKRKTYSADGKLLKDADHSDGFQFWSVKGSPPTADLTFIGNYAEGEIQGISGFNPGSGGYDRITMRWNWVDVQYWHRRLRGARHGHSR
jgi:hypothetical protein